MGDYTASTNIPNYYTNLDLSAGNIMTTAKVDAMITNHEAVYNAILQTMGYETVPLTDPGDKAVSKQYIEWRVVCEVDRVLRESDKDTVFDFKRNLCKEADKMLSKIMDGTLEFSEMRGEDPAIEFNNIDSNGNVVEPWFKAQNINDQLGILSSSNL